MISKFIEPFNKSTPSFIPELKAIFRESFYLNESEIIDSILQASALSETDSKKINILGFIKSQEVEISKDFVTNLATKGLTPSLETLNCSIKLENIHLLHKKIQIFGAMFFKTYDIPISVNMYVTPGPNVPCLAAHSDYTDVFVFQLVGSKEWTFYCDEDGAFLSGDNEGNEKKSNLLNSSIKKRITTRPDDVFHVPALMYHEASSTVGGSIHLTVSLNRFRIEHLLKIINESLLEEMNVSKFKNLSDEEFEDAYSQVMKSMHSEELREKINKKKQQMGFLSRIQLLSKGR